MQVIDDAYEGEVHVTIIATGFSMDPLGIGMSNDVGQSMTRRSSSSDTANLPWNRRWCHCETTWHSAGPFVMCRAIVIYSDHQTSIRVCCVTWLQVGSQTSSAAMLISVLSLNISGFAQSCNSYLVICVCGFVRTAWVSISRLREKRHSMSIIKNRHCFNGQRLH